MLKEPQAIVSIDFTNSGNFDQFSSSGFSVVEPLGTWSIGTASQINIGASGSFRDLVLEITLQPCILPGLNTSQSLDVAIADRIVTTYWSQRAEWATLSLNIPGTIEIPADGLQIRFGHSKPVSPASTGHSVDARPLAFMFRTLALTGIDATAHATPAPEPTPEPAPSPGPESAPALATGTADVHVGKDGWLFLIGGSNDVIRYYTDPQYFTDQQAERWALLLMGRRARLDSLGIKYLHIAAPDKISVYPNHFGAPLPNFENHPIAKLSNKLRMAGQYDLLVNPLDAFQCHPQGERLYLRTDTHWTYIAGQTVAELVTARLGYPRTLNLAGRTVSHYQHVWDLGSKLTPKVSELGFAVKTLPTVDRVHANSYTIAFEDAVRSGQPVAHGSIYTCFRNKDPSAIDKTLVIFGDSFMDFQESNTTSIFSEQFREVHFVWSPNIDYEFVKKVGADIVITELAERFMISLPSDEYSVIV